MMIHTVEVQRTSRETADGNRLTASEFIPINRRYTNKVYLPAINDYRSYTDL